MACCVYEECYEAQNNNKKYADSYSFHCTWNQLPGHIVNQYFIKGNAVDYNGRSRVSQKNEDIITLCDFTGVGKVGVGKLLTQHIHVSLIPMHFCTYTETKSVMMQHPPAATRENIIHKQYTHSTHHVYNIKKDHVLISIGGPQYLS